MMISSIFTLFWQLFVLFASCSGLGLAWRFFLPKEFSPSNKMLFSLLGGLVLVVLIPQNLYYLGMPVRRSAWLVLGAALVQIWLYRCKILAWVQTFFANGEIRTLAVVILATASFHGIVPIQQGLEWYHGKGFSDQLNYALLAEFLKEEPYSTSEQDIGLQPWLVRTVGFQRSGANFGRNSGSGVELMGLKKERLGQSIITAEISIWSGTDGEGGYAATVIFFLTLLAICVYVLLRETGIDRFMAGSGAILASCLPVVTRLSLDGFLSQISILFVFPFFASLLRHEELSARSFTLFFSLTLAYLVAAYSEIAPIGLCTLFLGVMFVRRDRARPKRLMLMSAILLIAVMNFYYLRNLIEFLAQQYYYAAHLTPTGHMTPNVLTLRDWSELIFGAVPGVPAALFFDACALLLGLLFLAGIIVLSRRDQLIFGVILLPPILLILYLATRTPPSYYPLAKITFTVLPFVMGLVFVGLSRLAVNRPNFPVGVLIKLVCAIFAATATAGSARYYSEVLQNGGMLRYLREPRFLNVCRELEEMKGRSVLLFETNPLLAAWFCYHARHNNVYFDGRFIGDSSVPPFAAFSKVPDLKSIDFVGTCDRIVDLKAPSLSCLTLVDDLPGEDRTDGHVRYWLGPPAGLRFLALRPMSANLKMQLGPGPEAATLPIDFFLKDDQGHVSRGEIWDKNVEVLRMNLPRGLSNLELSVKAKKGDPNLAPSFPILAELHGIEISEIDINPGE